ncbi:hypothetical protein MLD38_017500 [Melastoma candidum]|uniref:Uncharacterized protein n=1 Tax=Melastoma candidum TaxID=119954 RepID=A0ACB9QRC6_9MYRT|nr:hypothetical protein MLD38_017500 [Melastoma candidum]
MARFEEDVVAAGGAAGEAPRRKVMVAIDESESSYRALVWALKNLKENMKEVVIFMAQPPPQQCVAVAAPLSSALMFYPASGSPEFVNCLREQQRKFTLALLDKAKEVCANHGVNAETFTDEGDPKEAICSAVERFNINLLVMGEHDQGKIKRALVGSVSNYCVQKAKCPVLVVKPSQCGSH